MPLQRAAAGGHLDVVKLLIQHGAQINVQDKAVSFLRKCMLAENVI